MERILNAGRRAGSSKNDRRWAFIVIRDREHLEELAEVGRHAGHLAAATIAIALVTPDPARCIDHLGSRARGAEHRAGRLGAGHRQRSGHGV